MSAIPLVIFFSRIVITMSEKITDPSLKPVNSFSAVDDAEMYYKEFHEAREGCIDEDQLDNIWFHRTLHQRREINTNYNGNYCENLRPGYNKGCPLLSSLKKDSQNGLDDLYSRSLLSSANLLARATHEEIAGKRKDVGTMEEILCASDEDMKDRIAKDYQMLFQSPLGKDLKSFRNDDEDYQFVMLQCCLKRLCQNTKITPEEAHKEAQALRDIDPDENKENFKKKLIDLFDNYCEPDLRLIFQKYRQHKDGIGDAVDKAFEVERVRRAYNRLVRYMEDNCKFYADELHEAVNGCGINTDKINRIVLSRCQRDLGCILKKYKEARGESFIERLTLESGGENRYCRSIRYLCGE